MPVPLQELCVARSRLHSLAERVLSPDLEGRIGKIGLRAAAGGFAQPEHQVAGVRRRLRVDGVALTVTDGDVETWHPLSTLGAAAEVAGVDLTSPPTGYEATSAA